jgi:hypothetical protein
VHTCALQEYMSQQQQLQRRGLEMLKGPVVVGAV